MDNFLPWIEKYRPNLIDNIISHNQNIDTIKKVKLKYKKKNNLIYHKKIKKYQNSFKFIRYEK